MELLENKLCCCNWYRFYHTLMFSQKHFKYLLVSIFNLFQLYTLLIYWLLHKHSFYYCISYSVYSELFFFHQASLLVILFFFFCIQAAVRYLTVSAYIIDPNHYMIIITLMSPRLVKLVTWCQFFSYQTRNSESGLLLCSVLITKVFQGGDKSDLQRTHWQTM